MDQFPIKITLFRRKIKSEGSFSPSKGASDGKKRYFPLKKSLPRATLIAEGSQKSFKVFFVASPEAPAVNELNNFYEWKELFKNGIMVDEQSPQYLYGAL